MNKHKRCLWIVSAFVDYGNASLKELNERFQRSALNEEHETIQPRTFDRDRKYIADTLQIDIEYDPHLKQYYIVNPEEISNNTLYTYLLGSMHVNNLSSMAIKHKERIMLQRIPTGVEWLHTLLQAIDRHLTVCFSYQSYYSETPFQYEVIPCFLRLFEQRWYLICEYLDHSQTRVLALERMNQVVMGERIILPSANITPDTFYKDFYGIIRDESKAEEIVIKVYNHQDKYIRSVPIHVSQQELKSDNPNYALFSYYLHPTYDFIQQLLWHREHIEVVKPTALRKKMKELLQEMLNRYEP